MKSIDEIRADFPVLHQQVHGRPLVYLDNAATTQKPACVIEAIAEYYRRDNANVHRGVHALSERATHAYETARGKLARLLHAASEREIVFVRGATEGINLVAQCWGERVREGDEILISAMEHHSNIVPWQWLCQRSGAKLKVIPMNERGELIMEAFDRLLSERTRMVAVVHQSNALGTVNPVAEIVRKAHAAGAVVLLDGAQALAHMPVDVRQLDVDFYVSSAHKMYGPTGIGLLYAKEAWLDAMPPYQGGGDMIRTVRFEGSEYNDIPYKFEAGTPNIAGAIGFGAAVDYLRSLDVCEVAAHEQRLLAHADELARRHDYLRRIGTARGRCSVFSFVVEGVHPHDLGTILDHEGVAIRAGHHCAMPVMDFFRVPATARASFAAYNTIEEVDALFSAIERAHAMFA